MSLQVVCSICGEVQIDYDPEFAVLYEQQGTMRSGMLLGIGRRLDVCTSCKPRVEAVLKALQA